jgi:hypothetical protein
LIWSLGLCCCSVSQVPYVVHYILEIYELLFEHVETWVVFGVLSRNNGICAPQKFGITPRLAPEGAGGVDKRGVE